MHLDAATLSAILLAIIGGGGIVPFFYRMWFRIHPRRAEDQKTRAEVEAISSHAARESVEAMKGVMVVLRQQILDGHQENTALREEVRRLHAKVNELAEQVRDLGGSVEGLAHPEL